MLFVCGMSKGHDEEESASTDILVDMLQGGNTTICQLRNKNGNKGGHSDSVCALPSMSHYLGMPHNYLISSYNTLLALAETLRHMCLLTFESEYFTINSNLVCVLFLSIGMRRYIFFDAPH